MYGYWGTGSAVFFFMGFGGGSLIYGIFVIGLYLGKTNAGAIMSTSTLIIRKSGNAQIISLPKLLLEQIGAGIGDRPSAPLGGGEKGLRRGRARGLPGSAVCRGDPGNVPDGRGC